MQPFAARAKTGEYVAKHDPNQGLAGGFGGVIALVGPPDCWTIKAVVCAGVPGACITAEAAAWLLGMERRSGWPSHIGWSRAVGPARCMGTSPVVSRATGMCESLTSESSMRAVRAVSSDLPQL